MTYVKLCYSIVCYNKINYIKESPIKNKTDRTLKIWKREYKKGFTSYMLLLLLMDKHRYGYQLVNDLNHLTGGEVSFEYSGIYQILKNLSGEGYIEFKWKKSEKGPNRKYYYITNNGKKLIKTFTFDYLVLINNALNKLIIKHFPECLEKNWR